MFFSFSNITRLCTPRFKLGLLYYVVYVTALAVWCTFPGRRLCGFHFFTKSKYPKVVLVVFEKYFKFHEMCFHFNEFGGDSRDDWSETVKILLIHK